MESAAIGDGDLRWSRRDRSDGDDARHRECRARYGTRTRSSMHDAPFQVEVVQRSPEPSEAKATTDGSIQFGGSVGRARSARVICSDCFRKESSANRGLQVA
jgi:hypothetical protein